MKKFNFKELENQKYYTEGYFNNFWITKFINKLMLNGKKHAVEKILHPLFLNFKNQSDSENVSFFLIQNMDFLKLPLELKQRRRSDRYIAVPFPIKLKRQYIKVLSTITNEIKKMDKIKGNSTTHLKLKFKILACFCTLSKNKIDLNHNKFFRKKVLLRESIQDNKTNKRFRWI